MRVLSEACGGCGSYGVGGRREVHIELSVSTQHNERLETNLSFLRPIRGMGSMFDFKF